jgi:hypothetical protein
MGKQVLAVGIILILAGLVMVSYSNKGEKDVQSKAVNYALNAWNVTADLEKDDKILVEIRTSTTWWADENLQWEPWSPTEGGPPSGAVLYGTLDIFDPDGNLTRFIITWTPMISATTQLPYGLAFFNITVLQQDGLDPTILYRPADNAYDSIGGVVKKSGTYNVTLWGIFPSRTDPPSYLGVFKGIATMKHPYVALLPGGSVVGVAGAAISIFGLRSEKRKNIVKRKN